MTGRPRTQAHARTSLQPSGVTDSALVRAGIGTGMFRRMAGYGLATAGGIALLVMSSPILTRVYTPAAFGLFGVYTAAVALLGVLLTLRYELAIVIPKDDDQGWRVLVLCLASSIVLGILLFLGLAGSYPNVRALHRLVPPSFVWAIPLAAILAGAQSAITSWGVRCAEFRALGWSKLLYGGTSVIAQVGLGAALGPLGLVLGDIAGRLVGLLPLAWFVVRRRPAGTVVSWNDLRHVAGRYSRFAKFATPSAAINGLGLLAPTLLMAHLYGPVATGWFALGQRMIGAPSLLAGEAAGQVYTSEAAKARHQEPAAVESLLLRASAGLALVGVPVLAAIAVAGPSAFAVVFGDEWAQAGSFARLLAFGFAAQFIVGPVSQTLNLLEFQSWQFAWDLFRLLAVSSSLWLAAQAGLPGSGAVFTLSMAMLAAYGLLWALLLVAARKHRAHSQEHPATDVDNP